MADFTALKTAIQNAIKQNGNEEITGNLLQEVLLAIVTTLGDGSINELITALGTEATTRSQADGTLQQNINAEAQARQLSDSTLQGGINTAMQAINAINNAIGNGCVYAGIATPSTTPAAGKVFYLALTAGTYTNFNGLEVSQGINILKNNGSTWSLESFVGIDDAPTPSSQKLVKSGGVFDEVMKNGSAFDLSAYNGGATYADLNAALTALNALPTAYKRGGMSMKFVLSSDNIYEQYRFKLSSWTAAQFKNTANWQKQGAEVSATKETSTQKELFVGDSSIGMFAEGAIGKVASKAVLGDELFNASDIPDENIGKAYRVDTVSDISLNDYFIFDIDVEPNKAYNISGKVIKNETWDFTHIGGKFLSSTGSLGTFLYDSTINNVLVTPPNCIKIHFTALYADSNTLSFKEILNLNKTNENVAKLFSSQNRQDKELLKSVFGHNFFAETSKTSGEVWRATTNQWNNISGYGHFDFEVQEGDVYYISGYSGSMSPFGFRGNSSVGSGLAVSQEIYGDFYYTVPSGVKQLQISYLLTDTMSVRKIDINDRFANIQSQIDNNKDNVPLMIKDFSDSLYSGGYRYLAFFGGIAFNGKEYHCGRISYGHLALHDFYGHLAMFEIDANGNRKYFDPISDYSIFNGELRDINLSKTRDGQYMILSAGSFSTAESNVGELINSYLVIFNASLEVVNVIDLWNNGMNGYFAWGNTLETPDHYLLKCGYKAINGVDTVSLFKSNEKITETTTLTFTKIYDFPNVGAGVNEATIGYVGSLLCFITRVHSANARICFNETPDGSGTWDNLIDLGHDLQCPCIPLYQKGDIFAFGGGYTNGIPSQGGTRNPFIAYFNASTKQLLNITQIDTLTHWGGYPSMIDIGGNRYAMMYYDDNGENTRTAVFYQRVNVRYKCNVDYFL